MDTSKNRRGKTMVAGSASAGLPPRTSRRDAATGAFRAKTTYVIERVGGPTATARLFGVAKSQPTRWAKGQEAPSPRSRKHILDLDYVLSRLEDLYEAETAAQWLESPNAFLDGARPVDVLLHEGPAPVIEAVDATIAGSYA